MVASLRFLAQSVPVGNRLAAQRIAAAARSIFHRHSKTLLYTGSRSVHTEQVLEKASANQVPVHKTAPLSKVPQEWLSPSWRHPRFGFAATDFPHLVYIKLPRTATKEDVKALIARAGLQNTQIFMYYFLETGKPEDFCFVRIEDKGDVNAAIASLSRFTLLGSDLKLEPFTFWKSSVQAPNLLAGWLPSPSSDPSTRNIRPPRTEPASLLATMVREEWVQFSHLPLKLKQKDAHLKAAAAFYQQFYNLDVLGITMPKLHRTHGACCKILFGSQSDAKAARKLHVSGKIMGRPGQAKIWRGGPEVHKALWDCRQSLPKDLSDAEIQDLLEKQYQQIHPAPADVQRWKDYPTPESAVGVKAS